MEVPALPAGRRARSGHLGVSVGSAPGAGGAV